MADFQPIAPNPPLAAGLMLLASSFVAGTTLLAKALGTDTLGPPLHPLQISQGRFVFALLALVVATAMLRPQITKIDLKTHTLRVLLGWSGVTLMFAAAIYIPLSDAQAITMLNLVFAVLLAIPLLGERVGPVRLSAAAIALLGALILIRPTPDSFQPAALIALGAACLFGFEIIVIKHLSGREGPVQILLMSNFLGAGISTFAAVWVWITPTLAQWGALAGIGVLMALTQACFVNALARADASFATPFFYASLIFAALYDLVFFDVVPDAVSILGACVILMGAGLLAWREGRVQQAKL